MTNEIWNQPVRYVLCFIFNEAREYVVLLEKKRPDWQAGKLNGVGGKLEGSESFLDAVIREVQEETGIKTIASDWVGVAQLKSSRFIVGCYVCYNDSHYANVRTCTDEKVIRVLARDLPVADACISNLQWLVPLCLDLDLARMDVQVEYC